MITKKFNTSIIVQMIDNYERDSCNDIVDNLKFIESINSSEFVFMNMIDFRSYRCFFALIDRPETECVEVQPVNRMVTHYIPCEQKENSYDYHGPLCFY